MQLVNFVKSLRVTTKARTCSSTHCSWRSFALVAIAAVTAAGGSVKTILQQHRHRAQPARGT